MKGRCATGPGSRAFRENDQGLPALQRLGCVIEHVHAAVVADVLGLAQGATGERVVPEALLYHTVGVANQADQKYHVDQRGVVGNDHLPRSAEPFCASHLVGEYAGVVHEADEQPEQPADGTPRPAPMGLGVARQAAQQREEHQAQAEAAQPEQGKAHRRGQQPPVVGVTSFHRRLRCQCQVRPLQVCWQPSCLLSRQRSRSTACGQWQAGASLLAGLADSAQSSPAVNSRPTA
ncbi:hypothetical protein D3C76_877910 [compost metagenome]